MLYQHSSSYKSRKESLEIERIIIPSQKPNYIKRNNKINNFNREDNKDKRICYKCKKKGHIAKFCPSNNKHNNRKYDSKYKKKTFSAESHEEDLSKYNLFADNYNSNEENESNGVEIQKGTPRQ